MKKKHTGKEELSGERKEQNRASQIQNVLMGL